MTSTTQIKYAMDLFIFHKKIRFLLGAWSPFSVPVTVDSQIKRLIQRKSRIKFIQVGASDCGLNDPLKEYVLNGCAKGLVIEPIKQALFRAQEQYRNISGLYFANCAIDYKKGTRTIYKIKNVPGLPEWAYQVCSFSRDVLLKHEKEIPEVKNLVVKEDVRTETLTDLMEKSGFERPDLLLIDTEGFDADILKMFPFKNHCPALVIFEHKHLDNKQQKNSSKLLKSYSFQMWKTSTDTICWKKKY